MKEKQPKTASNLRSDQHLWEITAVREFFLLAIIIVVIWALWYLRPIVLPVLVSFGLAYIIEPIVARLHRRLSVPRLFIVLAILIIFLAAGIGLVAWALPHVADQVSELVDRMPSYFDTVSDRYGIDVEDLRSQIASGLRPRPREALQGIATGARVFGFVGSVVGTTTYIAMAVFMIVTMFVYLSTQFDRLSRVKRIVPESKRDLFERLVRGVDQACSGYIRGQLVVAVFTTTGFCVGFWLVDVPYWFVVSIVGGVLSLIPYGQCSGWLLAIMLKYLESIAAPGEPSGSFLSIVLLPTVVYAITQSSETWLITPLVQSQATRLHPVTILLVLLTGGFAAGIVGVVIAIPLAASLKIAYKELVSARIRDIPDAVS